MNLGHPKAGPLEMSSTVEVLKVYAWPQKYVA